MNALDWSAPITCDAYGSPTRVVDPPTMTDQKFVYWDGSFRAYLLDGTPYNASLRKQVKYHLRNVEDAS